MFNIHGDDNWRQNISGAPEFWWPIGILFLLGIILCVTWTIRNYSKKFGLWLVLVWFILGLLPEIISDEGIPHALRSLLVVIPAMIFAAIAGIWLYDFLCRYFARKNWKKVIINIFAIIFLVAVATYGYYDYFVAWAQNPNVPGAFNADYAAIGDAINALPPATQKYLIVNAGGVTDYGIPVPAATVMYITDSFVPDAAAQKDIKNIHYLLPDETSTIPAQTPSDTIFYLN